MTILHIDSSITGPASVSRQLTASIVGALRKARPDAKVVRRDLDADPIPHLDLKALSAAHSDPALDEFLRADVVVIGAPMYNFTISSQLKAWLDRILVAGKTFRYTEQGPVGLAGGKKVIIASSRGGLYLPGTASNDFQETYLNAVLRFIGIDDVQFVRAEGVALEGQREAALKSAQASAAAVTEQFALAAA